MHKLVVLLIIVAVAQAANGPEFRSLRVRGMGGAYIAVADRKDALYYNPAGLNLINRLGNFEKNPDMGYMPRERWEFNIATVNFALPANEISDAYHLCGTSGLTNAVMGLFSFDFNRVKDIDPCPTYYNIFPDDKNFITDSLKAHPELADNLTKFDRQAVEIGAQVSILEFAMHNFGFGIYANSSVAPYIDLGVIVPSVGYEPLQIDAVAQTAFAFSPVDNWSVGVGFKAARRIFEPSFELYPLNYEDDLDTLKVRWEKYKNYSDISDSLLKLGSYGYAIDLGVLYQVNRTVRVGSSLRNIFFGKLGNQKITPNLSFGAMTSPMFLQSNSWWWRKVNFALDYVNVLDGTLGDMPLSHLNFGGEIEQVIVPAILTISGGTGFAGGYWSGTVGLEVLGFVGLRFATYAEERGSRTGQNDKRFWQGEVSVGF